MDKFYTMRKKAVVILEYTLRAKNKKEAQELFDEWECDEEGVVDIEQVIEEYPVE